MALKKTIGKLDAYYDRLKESKVDQIKVSHVQKVLEKLQSKEKILKEEIKEAHKESKKERLEGKRAVIKEQMKRAKWLMKKIT